ncbi:hypothetical protein FB45DRAFT_1005325 [Roridomyces roridus]|uniref:Uncharacterized protein n=1 Tax=Roridomyces roridus TaxID=1738132 RepID=A0AAD7BNU7_9AGAR|nr:hypothetical protein FB45DRAFT_1005325 [Roridomyces roridus]
MGWIRSWVKGTGTPVKETPVKGTGVRSLDEVGTGRKKLKKGKSPNEDRSPVKIDPDLLEPEPELGQDWSGVANWRDFRGDGPGKVSSSAMVSKSNSSKDGIKIVTADAYQDLHVHPGSIQRFASAPFFPNPEPEPGVRFGPLPNLEPERAFAFGSGLNGFEPPPVLMASIPPKTLLCGRGYLVRPYGVQWSALGGSFHLVRHYCWSELRKNGLQGCEIYQMGILAADHTGTARNVQVRTRAVLAEPRTELVFRFKDFLNLNAEPASGSGWQVRTEPRRIPGFQNLDAFIEQGGTVKLSKWDGLTSVQIRDKFWLDLGQRSLQLNMNDGGILCGRV